MSSKKLEKLSHYSIILIALLALVVSVWQVRIAHRHNKLTVMPYLDSSLEQGDSTLTVSFSNQGFGPAIIKDISFQYQGKTYESLEDYLNASGEVKNRRGSFNYGENTIVASGAKKLLVHLLNREVRGVEVQIIYESIYQEKRKLGFKF